MPDLRSLNPAVERARAERDHLQPGDQILPLVEYLDERGERATWRVVGQLPQHEPACAGQRAAATD